MNGRILNIATQSPAHRFEQGEILRFMQDFHGQMEKVNRQLKVLYHRSGIGHRYSVLPDFRQYGEQARLIQEGEAPGLSPRLAIFQEEAGRLGAQAARKVMEGFIQAQEVTHLIAVSCTGLYAPGLEFQLIKSLGLAPTVSRHPINFVGCYAAVPALHLANLICKTHPQAKVLVVSVELCTLHLQDATDRDTLTANAIFGDGAAASLVVGPGVPIPGGLELKSHLGEVHPEGESDMSWVPSEKGFLMRLSAYVPQLIQEEIRNFVLRGLEKAELRMAQVQWAFHPGGAQILQKIQSALGLERDEMALSYEVLRDYGNMSSTTLLYVLKALMEQTSETEREHIYCAAFGPGLTFESIVLQRVPVADPRPSAQSAALVGKH